MNAPRLATTNGRFHTEPEPSPIDPRDIELPTLGSMVLLNSIIPDVCEEVDVDDFYLPCHQYLFSQIVAIYESGDGIDLATLLARLSPEQAPGNGWFCFLKGLLETVPHGMFGPQYSRDVRNAAIRRRTTEASRRLTALANDPGTPIEELLAVAAEMANTAESVTRHRNGFEFISSADLSQSEFGLKYLIPGVLAEAQPAILAGHQKTLKTRFCTDLALSLSNQQPFLGKFYCTRPTRVIVFSGEAGGGETQEASTRIARTKGMPLSSFDNIRWCFGLPKLSNQADRLTIKRAIRDFGAEVMIYDPVYLGLDIGDSASNLFKVGQQLKPLADLAAETGVTPILVHHMNRASSREDGPPQLEGLAFAGFAEFARQWILLSRREKYSPDNPGHHELWMSIGGSAGHSGLYAITVDEGGINDPDGRRWNVEVSTAGEVLAEAAQEAKEAREAERERRLEEDVEKARKAISRFPKGETKTTLRESAGLSSERFGVAVGQLIDLGEAEPCEVKKSNGQIYDGFKKCHPDHPDSE